MSNQPYFDKFNKRDEEAINYWWRKVFSSEKNLKQIAVPNSPLKPTRDCGLIYYYYVDGELIYIGQTTNSLAQRMVTYSYRDGQVIEMLNAFKEGRLTIATKEVEKVHLHQIEKNEIRIHSKTNELWNIKHSYWNSPIYYLRTTTGTFFKAIFTAILFFSVLLLALFLYAVVDYSNFGNPADINNDTAIEPRSQQLDVEKMASVLTEYKQKHNELPAYEEITTPYPADNPTRNIFFHSEKSLSFYKEANIKNTLMDNLLEPGQSYYTSAPSVSFEQNQPLPNVSNFHILVGHKCQTDTLETYNLIPADKLNFAIVYYSRYENISKCLSG